MHFPKKKHTLEISEPMDGRPIDTQPHPQMLHNLAGISPQTDAQNSTSTSTNTNNATSGVQAPMSAAVDHTFAQDPKLGGGARQAPTSSADQYQQQQPPLQQHQQQQMGPGMDSTAGVEPRAEVVEGNLPFKDQVRAYIQVHRGTVRRDHEQVEMGKAVLRGDIPPPPAPAH